MNLYLHAHFGKSKIGLLAAGRGVEAMNIILLATAWGPKFGGINAFNEDFAAGLATYVTPVSVPERKVFCLVPKCTEAEVAAAALSMVTLIEVADAHGSDPAFDAIATTVLPHHPELPPLDADDHWVGHDVITGWAAIKAARASGTKSAVIMHMNFEAYKFMQDGDEECERLAEQQRDLCTSADRRFAVGPLLRDHFQDETGEEVTMLVPGLCSVKPRTARSKLRGVAFGRLDRRNDIVKQGTLVAASYGRARSLMRQAPESDLQILPTSLKMFGTSRDEDSFVLHDVADEHAQGVAPMLVLPFDSRTKVFDELARANLAIVPSLHDGFALTGWEAIAAETPLIVSEETGLWRLLVELWSHRIARAYVQPVHVQGNQAPGNDRHFTVWDVENLAAAIVDAARHREERIRLAADLKHSLQSKRNGCTWESTAEEFLIGLGLVDPLEITESRFIGEWMGYLIEGSSAQPPELIRERINLWRSDNPARLRGHSFYSVSGDDRAEEFSDLKVPGGVLSGRTEATKGSTRDSLCQFQVAPRFDGRFLDGVVTWSSTVETSVDWSRYIWVKAEAGNEDLLAFAEREMLLELKAVRKRIKRRGLSPSTPDSSFKRAVENLE